MRNESLAETHGTTSSSLKRQYGADEELLTMRQHEA